MKFHFKRHSGKAEKCLNSFMKTITTSSDLVRQSLSATWRLDDEDWKWSWGRTDGRTLMVLPHPLCWEGTRSSLVLRTSLWKNITKGRQSLPTVRLINISMVRTTLFLMYSRLTHTIRSPQIYQLVILFIVSFLLSTPLLTSSLFRERQKQNLGPSVVISYPRSFHADSPPPNLMMT